MPIKPENRAKYPKDWKAIRAEVLARAGNKCEECGVKNYDLGLRDLTGKWWSWTDFEEGRVPADVDFERVGQAERKAYKIVLTIAHLDNDPANNGTPGDRPNLKALCQYHHLKYDHQYHMANARATRAAKKGMVDMFQPQPLTVRHTSRMVYQQPDSAASDRKEDT